MYFKKRKLKNNNNKKTDISHLSFLSIKNPLSSFTILKKSLSLFLSVSILYTQLFFSFFITQTFAQIVIQSISSHKVYASTLGENSNPQYNPNHSLNNINDNPINHIIPDNSVGQGNTTLDRAENGTPIININSATQGGVSANYYKDFNINDENLILNNYQGNTTKGQAINTNLGGVIYSNPNMNQPNSREANIILNEITTNRQTKIEGYLEVAGKKADVIIANPNGIMISGGGFINTSKLSLITGNSGACLNGGGSSSNCGTLDSNGNLNPFQISNNPNAIIQVVGRNLQDEQGRNIAYNLGIDATNQDYLALIGRVIQINGDIIGNTNTQLDIKTGNDKATFNSNTNTFDEITSDTTKGVINKPEFAIDSTALGGIYAGRINIIATEQGVGTKIRSDVIASVDDINFDVNGNIILKDANIQALNKDKNINIKNQNKKFQQVSQNKQIIPSTPGYAEYTLELDNSNLNAKKIDIQTDNLINKNDSTIYGTTETKINATNTIANINNSTIYANQLIDLQAINLNNINNSLIYSPNELKINLTGNLLNQNNSSIETDNKLTIIAGIPTDTTNTGNITNDNNSLITSGNIFNLSTNNLINNDNSTIYATNQLSIFTTQDLINTSHSLIRSKQLTIDLNNTSNLSNTNNSNIFVDESNLLLWTMGNIQNTNQSTIYTTQNINIQANNLTNDNQSIIEADKNLSVAISNTLINNNNSTIKANNNNDNLNLNLNLTLNNNTLTIKTNNLLNTANSLLVGYNTNIIVSNILANNQSTIYTINNSNITTNQLNNNDYGFIYTINNASITANNLNNSNTTNNSNINYGIYTQNGNTTLNIQNNLNNNYGIIDTGGNLSIYYNHPSTNSNIQTNINSIFNQNGIISALGSTIIQSNSINNNNGSIFSNGNLLLNNIINNNGTIEGNSNIIIDNANTDNNGIINPYTNNSFNNISGIIRSTNPSSSIIINTTNGITNTNGTIENNGNIALSMLADFITQGIIKSTQGTTTINAKNITINNKTTTDNQGNLTNLTSYNLTLNANGNITNNNTFPLQITNNLIFNILKDNLQGTNNNLYKNTGNLYNYGIIIAGGNATIYAENSVYNGRATEIGTSQATISAGNLSIEVEQRIMNYGFLQALSIYDSNNRKIAGTGNLLLKTNAEINDDYKLNDTNTAEEEITLQVIPFPDDVRARIDILDTITDIDELNNLLNIANNTNNENEFYLIQKRIRLLNLQEVITLAKEQYTYNEDNFKIGTLITIDTEDNDGNTLSSTTTITDELVQEQLQNLLGSQYNPADWQIDLTPIEQQIDQDIQSQQDRLDVYNQQQEQISQTQYNTNKEIARQNYIARNGKDDAGFAYQDFTYTNIDLQTYISLNPTTEKEINKEQLLQQPFQEAEQQRLLAIEEVLNNKKQSIQSYKNTDWNNLTESQLQSNINNLFITTNNILNTVTYNPNDWSLIEFDTSANSLSEFQKHLSQLRTDNKNQSSLEKTGIHNYGRIYSNNDMTLTSKSVLHNNNNSLIYSNNNINFNIDQVLFNNAGGTNIDGQTASGYGIFAKNDININGYNGEVSRLNQLINYDGRIEANKDITIKTNKTINYGSDSINIYDDSIKYNATEYTEIEKGMPCYDCGVDTYKKRIYTSTLKSNFSIIQSNNGKIDIDSRDSIINYNSTIYGKKSVKLQSDTIFNAVAEFNVNNIEYRAKREIHRRRASNLWKKTYHTYYQPDQTSIELLKSTNTQARIVSGGDIFITASVINNGALTNKKDVTDDQKQSKENSIKEKNITNGIPEDTNRPYTTQNTTQSQLDKISNTHTIDVLAGIQLPSNNYGIFQYTGNLTQNTSKQPRYLFTTDPLLLSPQYQNSNLGGGHLTETDPLLIDATRFLGSQYFMNRIGLDPFSIDQVFLGDTFMEHEMIRRSLEQISLFQNTHISDDEIDVYIDNLYKTLDADKVQQYNLEFGKELTSNQINSLKEDIVWYVSKDITLPNKDVNGNNEIVKVLVPQVYLSQNSVNKLTNNTDELLKLQAELSIKQATDTAITDSTNAGNKAISDKINELDNQAQQEAKAQAKNDAQNNVNIYLSDLQLNNPEQYNQNLQDIIDTLDKTKEVKNTPCIRTTNSCYQTQPKSQNELLAEAKTILNSQLYEQTIAELEQQYYNEIKTAKLNDFTQPTILIDDAGAPIKTLSKQEQLYQNTYNNTYPLSYNTALAKAEEQNKAKADTSSLIAGNNVTIQSLNPTKSSTLNNSGTIQGNRKVVITTDQINNSTSCIGGNQATITAGELVYLNTIQYKTDDKGNYQLDNNGQKIALSSGIINNNSGLIGATGIKDKDGNIIQGTGTTYIATSELNNITNSQREEYKINNYEKTETHIGTTAQITTNGNLIIDTTGDINLKGSSILAKGDVDLTIGGDLNSSVVEDYNREYRKTKTSDGIFGKSTESVNETASLKNISSYITSTNGDTNINVTNIISIGTQFSAENDLNLTATNNIILLNATDYNYNYSYYKESKFDVNGVLVNIGAAVAVGALTGGPGAAAMAGAMATTGASQMQKGSVDVSMTYDETIKGSSLTGNNINIKSGGDTTMISTNINNTSINTLNINTINDFNITTGGELLIDIAEERHDSQESHDKFGGDLGKAALGGVITGLATGIGMQGGAYLGELSGSAISSVVGTTTGEILGTTISASISSFTNIVGIAMSQTTISGGSFKDVMKSGEKSITSEDTLKSVAISGLTSGLTIGATGLINGVTSGAISTGTTATSTFSERLTSALYESAISTTTSTAIQSSINKDSFMGTLKNQATNTLIGAVGNLGAKEIGLNYHSGNFEMGIDGSMGTAIGKITQLTLHAGLGALTSKLGGNDAFSGAMSGVMGEVTAELFGNTLYGSTDNLPQYQKNNLKEIGAFAGGLFAMFVGKIRGLDDKEIIDNIYSGQRIGKNAVENNLLYQVTRDLNSDGLWDSVKNSAGNHSFDVWIPDDPNEATPEGFTERGLNYIPPVDLGEGQEGWILGGYYENGNLVGRINDPIDQQALQNYFNNGGKSTGFPWDFDVEIREVKPVNGISDTEFGFNIISNTQNYITNTLNNPIKYSLIPSCIDGYNCNSFSNGLLQNSGAGINYNNDFVGVDLGRNQPVPSSNFENKSKQTKLVDNQFYIDIQNGVLPSVFTDFNNDK